MPQDDALWAVLGLIRSTYDSGTPESSLQSSISDGSAHSCDPVQMPLYLSALTKIVLWLLDVVIVPQDLENLVVSERSRGQFTEEDFNVAIRMLGFGPDN